MDSNCTKLESLQKSQKFRAWKRNLEKSGCTLQKMEPMQLCTKPNGSLLFAFLKTEVIDPHGRELPAYALLRGHACVIVTVIENSQTHERQFLMLKQRRIGHGAESLEFPAGMLDEDVDDAIGVAVRELEEETGLEVARANMLPLSDKPLYSSPGLDDEAIHYFICHLRQTPEEIQSLQGRKTGLADEHEHITLSLWSYEAAWAATTSLQVRFGLLLAQEVFHKSPTLKQD